MKVAEIKVTNNMEAVDHLILSEALVNNATEFDGVRFANVPLFLLKTDENYQRPVDSVHVAQLTPFKRNQASALTVSYRDGWFWIIDGQHRYRSALMNRVDSEGREIKALNCIILTGLTSKQEAKIFKDLNITQKKPDPYKLFKANVWSGDMSDPDAAVDITIFNICDAKGVQVKKFGRGSTGKTLRCLSRAQMIIKSERYDGKACFKWIIDFINATKWANTSTAYTREIVLMLKDFWVDNHGNTRAEERLIDIVNGKVNIPMPFPVKKPDMGMTPELFIRGAKYFYGDYGQTGMYLFLKDLISGTIK